MSNWPVVDGSYVVGDSEGPVAVCSLTSEDLPARIVAAPGVAIAGQLFTANLGIERIILNVTSNPSIRFLLLCGKESKVFRPGQSLVALIEEGTDNEQRIREAEGYDPVLPNLSTDRIESFRKQVELVDWTGEQDADALEEQISGLLARNPGRFEGELAETVAEAVLPSASFVPIRPGGQRQPLQYDPKGYFVITLDHDEEQIVLRHYLPDHTPAHEMRGRVAESMYLGLLREGLISQLSHASYLGAELAKAESALHLDLIYRQDRTLRTQPRPADEQTDDADEAAGASRPMPRIAPAMTLEQLLATDRGSPVDVVLEGETVDGDSVTGRLAEPQEKSPFNSFTRTNTKVTVRKTAETRLIMGEEADVVVGGIFRAQGALTGDLEMEAKSLVVLTRVATIT